MDIVITVKLNPQQYPRSFAAMLATELEHRVAEDLAVKLRYADHEVSSVVQL